MLVYVYSVDIVDDNYILWVDEMTSIVFHINPWRHWFLSVNAKCSRYFLESGVVDDL